MPDPWRSDCRRLVPILSNRKPPMKALREARLSAHLESHALWMVVAAKVGYDEKEAQRMYDEETRFLYKMVQLAPESDSPERR